MNLRHTSAIPLVGALCRAAFFALALFAPLAAMQAVEASSQAVIEDSRAMPSGAGLVLLVGLQRS